MGRRRFGGVVAAVLPTLGGACCVGVGIGLASVGGVVGATLAWLSPLLLGAVFIVAGGLLVRRTSGRPWRSWHALAAIISVSYMVSALVVVPLLGSLIGGAGTGTEVLP